MMSLAENKISAPETALKEIQAAIASRDQDKLFLLVDIPALLNTAYDDATVVLSARHDEFHELYPADLYFQFGADNIRQYNEKYRNTHLTFIERFIAAFCDGHLLPPRKFEENPVRFAAFAFKLLHKMMKSKVTDVTVDGHNAAITLKISGNIIYRKLIKHPLYLELAFKYVSPPDGDNGRWRLVKILNVAELASPVVDIAETYWPKSWDLGLVY